MQANGWRMRLWGYPCLQGISPAMRPLWNVPPAGVLPDLEGGDASKGKQSGLVGAPVSPTGGQDWLVPTRDQTYQLLCYSDWQEGEPDWSMCSNHLEGLLGPPLGLGWSWKICILYF